MSSLTRQNSLLVAEDWTKIYQTFRDADFQSYDFATLRKTMIDYLRLYYPEDFNDFVESSEYIALIDLIAFLGQSLAFRTDINARENFLDTAERRDSILKLARLIGYSPKRSVPASGLLKISSVTTTEAITDSNGLDLSNLVVTWNDSTNSNWLEQFTLILNATLLNSQVIGKPGNTQTISGIRNDEYTINITSSTLPAYAFSSLVNDRSMNFEAVSATSVNQPYLYEVEPKPVSRFNLLYRNDNQGNSSNNTGFFTMFKQGTLQYVDFDLTEGIPNRALSVSFNNINNTDIWLYNLDINGKEVNKWTQVPSVVGVNVIYNNSEERNLYQVNTTNGDQVELVFGDGSFANIPQGPFRLYFRTSNNQAYKITPDEIQNMTIPITYVSRSGNQETLTIRANLTYTVTNAAVSETINDIRTKAPQQYYTQGRMITGEDYNIIPYTAFSNIIKVKAVNRTSSGVSRYLDVNDASGKYSNTNIFAQDGRIYREEGLSAANFTFLTSSTVQQLVQDELSTILTSKEIQHFYYSQVIRSLPVNISWVMCSVNSNSSTGYFLNGTTGNIAQLGNSTSEATSAIKVGAIVKFVAPSGKYFNARNQLVSGTPKNDGDKLYLYASVANVIGDGTNGGAGAFSNGQGPVTLSVKVPSQALISEIIPVFKSRVPDDVTTQIATKILAYNDFALRFDLRTSAWAIVDSASMASNEEPFSWDNAGVVSSHSDASWFVKFIYNTNVGYTIYWRTTNYIFESTLETKFYFDEKVKIYDSKTGTTIQDSIKVLRVNSKPDPDPVLGVTLPLGVDYLWYVHKNITDIDGYNNQNKVMLTFTDTNADGIPDDPDLFATIVAPDTSDKLVFFKNEVSYTSFVVMTPIDGSLVDTTYASKEEIEADISNYVDGQLFYVISEGKFYLLTSGALVEQTAYVAKTGRESLYFQYTHNSPSYRRIDPSPINIIDLYLLTSTYANDYQAWVRDTTNTLAEPVPPTTDDLKREYSDLENFKAVSDSIVFNSAKFKPLFGPNAVPTLQATFKVVKNVSMTVSDNDIKSSVIDAINTYFAVSNWDFGETFYFSELSAYLHSKLSPNVSSVIIVPVDPTALFGSLYQINSEANEILTSSATVDNVEIISAITAAQINANFAG